ncbi:hypothetical protein HDV01_001590 [Terramyces sp. JEL0728]|nr:hypothetical protein HDV01_001590 [Terramyces sp. JEL0728]
MNSTIFLSELNEILERPMNSTEFLSQVTDIQIDMLNYQNKRRKLRDLGEIRAVDFEFERREDVDFSDVEDSEVDLSDIISENGTETNDIAIKENSAHIDLATDEIEECIQEGTVIFERKQNETFCIPNTLLQNTITQDTHGTSKTQLSAQKNNVMSIEVREKAVFSPKEEDQVCPNRILELPRLQIVPEVKKIVPNFPVGSSPEAVQIDVPEITSPAGKIPDKKRLFYNENIPLPPSILDKTQHQFYLDCLRGEKYRKENLIKFQAIDQMVNVERYQFSVISQAILSLNRQVFEHLTPEAEHYYEVKLSERLQRVNEDYNKNVQCVKCIDLKKDYTISSILQYTETLLKLGQPSTVSRNLNVKLSSPEVHKVSPPVMSMDLNVEMLLKDNLIDIAMSSSSFNALLSAVGESPGFEIPLIIKNVQQKHKLSKVIIIDKSLAMAKQTARDKLQKYYKNSLKQFNKERGQLWYNVWKFGKFTILLRTKQETQMECNGKLQNVNTRVKLEYLPDNGSELITEYEKIKWWGSTFVKPNAKLMIAKIHPARDVIIENQEKQMDQLIQDGNFPIPYSNGLYEILNELQRYIYLIVGYNLVCII